MTKQKTFFVIWLTQILSVFMMLVICESYTKGIPIRPVFVVLGITALVGLFAGLVYMWVQQQIISDLEYQQEIFPQLLNEARSSTMGDLK